MIVSSADIPSDRRLETDLLIVGGGAAGITLAQHFSEKKCRVVLLESGGEVFDGNVQALYRGDIVGLPTDPLDASRLRFFGGTTNHWSGWCRPLEMEDFEKRPGWPQSGWPITRHDLDAYYARAGAICQLGPFVFDDPQFWQHQSGGSNLKLLPFKPDGLRSAIFQLSPPTKFGEIYGPKLKAAPNVHVILDATALELLPAPGHHVDQSRKQIAGVRASSIAGKPFEVTARATVVAAGGIESARLLLLSDKISPNGAGNEGDLVGRYFMDHVWLRYGSYLRFAQEGLNLPFYFDYTKLAGGRVFATIAPTRSLMEKEGIANFRIWLTPSRISTEGNDSAHVIMNAIRHGTLPDHFFHHLGNVLSQLDVLADNAYKTITGSKIGFVSGSKSAPYDGAWVDLNFEQQPNPNSRVKLGTERDALGQRRVQLDWRLTDVDRRTATRAFDIAAHEFGRLGLGRTRTSFEFTKTGEWPSTIMGSDHHIGTARMSNDPKTGVVDANCRVHSTANLYVAGSAVFPTGGFANPTLTIVALALRLAEHLEGKLA